MCGIVGFIARSGVCPDRSVIRRATDLLEHRGPDDAGIWMSPRVSMGFRRLSIQDLSARGHQPMVSRDGRYVIVFNGEIYNFKILRKQLEAKGFVFHSGTDTEVLLTLYESEGRSCLARLNGMFAFAVYDTLRQRLFLARDRFGIKPLYIFRSPIGLLFASEIKAFLPFVVSYGLPWDLDGDLVREYLLFRYVSGPGTMIRNVHRCPPGHWVQVDSEGRETGGGFYDVESPPVEAAGRRPKRIPVEAEARYIEEVKERLVDSIRLRMISDAPIGVALSGGVDSSLVTALMREIHDGPIDTFSIGFASKQSGERRIDESEFSSHTAEKFETNHHHQELDERRYSDLYFEAIWHNDEPLNFPHSTGIYLLSKFASRKVKVLLGGEGADEAFAGYNRFKTPHLYYLKNRFMRVADADTLLSRELIKGNGMAFRKGLIDGCRFQGLDRQICFNLKTYLTSIENRLDKMSMAAGLEVRVPFLDHRVVECALGLPGRMKVRGETTKYVLKRLAERYLPLGQIYRPKVGFSTPLNQWLRNEAMFGKFTHVLEEEKTLTRPIYNRAGIEKLMARFRNGRDTFKYSLAGRVWILMNLEYWIRTFLEEKRQLTGLPAIRSTIDDHS